MDKVLTPVPGSHHVQGYLQLRMAWQGCCAVHPGHGPQQLMDLYQAVPIATKLVVVR